MKSLLFPIFFIFFLLNFQQGKTQQKIHTAKPWTIWWWMGSAVNKEDIQKQLIEFKRIGIGGVNIVPIYGVKGYENQFKNFLSEDWMETVHFTINEATKLNLGVDITLGTGWPYGGKMIDKENGGKFLFSKIYTFNQTQEIAFSLDTVVLNNKFKHLISAFAINSQKQIEYFDVENLEVCYKDDLPKSDWKLYIYGFANTNFKVKRPAPGGEGLVIDYFSKNSVDVYLNYFDSIFRNTKYFFKPRSFYHDSYEAFKANWTDDLVLKFKDLHGYDLLTHMHILADTNHVCYHHVLHDIRATLSELLYSEFTLHWTEWSRKQQIQTRNQAHGSPGNLLDLYGLADIPETESFGCSGFKIPKLYCDPDYEENKFGRPSPLMMKFASSSAHVMNKKLVSSETTTWLSNHFKVSLSSIKPQIDELFVSGINHIFYHGTTYSPQQESFPGWLFYASTNYGKFSHFYDELPLLNSYIENCQNLLQNSEPDNDILLYFPIDELWTKSKGDILLMLDVHKYQKWFGETEFGKTAQFLWDNGFSFDYISDNQLKNIKISTQNDLLVNNKNIYKIIVVPKIDFINKETMFMLDSLAKNGAKIIFINQFPKQFSGYLSNAENVKESQNVLQKYVKNIQFQLIENTLIDFNKLPVKREIMKSKGLDFIRKKSGDTTIYFVTNLSNKFYSDSITLSDNSTYFQIIDPLTNEKFEVKSNTFYLELFPGKSLIIKSIFEIPKTFYKQKNIVKTIELKNNWSVKFEKGNTENLKPEYHITKLTSWTDWEDENLKYFCGKGVYTTHFKLRKIDKNSDFIIVFENIYSTASIKVNGIDCGTIWCLPYHISIPTNILLRNNILEITVQNLSSNLMRKFDKENPQWKKFYDINFADITYQPFRAENWKIEPSGIVGKVEMIEKK